MSTDFSILQIQDPDERQRLLDAIETSYLYAGPAKAMKSIQKDLKDLCDRILSGDHPEDIQTNVDTFDFLLITIRELGKRHFSKSDFAGVDQFKASCFLATEKIFRFYSFEDDVTGYAKAASRFHNSLRLFRPAQFEEDHSFRSNSKRAKALITTIDVLDTIDQVANQLGNVITFDKDRKTADKPAKKLDQKS